MNIKKNSKHGFTLAELLVVVAIIAVLVAIAIPIFTTQLEKSRDAVTIANLRSAYAEAAAIALTADDPTDAVTVTVTSKGTQDGWSSVDVNLPFALGDGMDAMENTPDTYEVTFTFTEAGECTATVED